MDDENQRRTWEYLQSITRKEGSYGKILSDAFVQILDGNYAIEQEALQRNDTDGVIEQILSNCANASSSVDTCEKRGG